MKSGELVFAMSGWTICKDGEKFFICKTWTGKQDWSRPYKTLTSACNAIARHLEREWTERAARQTAFHGRYKKKAA